MQTNAPTKFHSYDDVLAYLEPLKGGPMRLETDSIRAVLAQLGNPQDQIKTIHIVGTNGKGSTSSMLASIYHQSGYQTGLFTSPHILEVRERIQLNGEFITSDDFLESAQVIYETAESLGLSLTYFTFLNAMAFWIFAHKKVDIAIIEAGLGGRLDSTNIIAKPSAVVITPISLDHQVNLGDTLKKIAFEKAFVIKRDVPVITTPQPDEAMMMVLHMARDHGGIVHIVNPELVSCDELVFKGNHALRSMTHINSGDTYQVNLLGRYQAQNVSTVLTVLRVLGDVLPVNNDALKTGLENVNWPGRFQYFPERGLVIDGSHNEAGIQTLLETIRTDFAEYKIHWGVSLLQYRDIEILMPLTTYQQTGEFFVLENLPEGDRFYTPKDFKDLSFKVQDFKTFLMQPQKPGVLKILTGSLYTAGSAVQEILTS